MIAFIVVAIVLLVGAAATFLVRRRSGGGGLEGVHGFRRHMDALSSEARRDVIGRLNSNEWQPGPELQTRGIAGQPGVGGRMNANAPEQVERGADGAVAPESIELDQTLNGEGTEATE